MPMIRKSQGGDLMDSSKSTHSLPRRIIVSLQLGGVFFAIANVICVGILGFVYHAAKHEPKTLEVKGSAKKAITSDTISWTGTITTRNADLVKAYDKLKADADRLGAFLKTAGVPEKEITFSSINTSK